MTLVSSAVRNDLDVWSYIKDVLDHLLAGETDYTTLRPDAWAAAHPEKIREYRTTERRDRGDRKKTRRATRRPRDHRKSNRHPTDIQARPARATPWLWWPLPQRQLRIDWGVEFDETQEPSAKELRREKMGGMNPP